MRDFEYLVPTRVVFGRNTEERTGELIAAEKPRKVLIHFGGGSARKSGLLDRVTASLDAADVPWIELGGVVPNPRLSKVREGIALARLDFRFEPRPPRRRKTSLPGIA